MPKPPESKKPKINWRMVLRVSVWSVIFGSVAYAGMQVRSFMLRDPRFALECSAGCKGIEVQGAVHSSLARIDAVFAQDAGKSVFDIPLDERRRYLLAIDWVRDATVMRVWPDKIRITIQERTPVAFASLPMAHSARHWLALIDENGVLLSIPPHSRFPLPVLSGITEDQTEAARQKRVEAMQHLLADLGPQAKDISEINAAVFEDLRVMTTVEGHAAELWLGDQHYRSRYRNFISHYRQIHEDSPQASIFDLRLDDRILVR
ncbi:MAG TPA: FtsQ-type POTRA domain-containing protein [Bryobacteraceae bacterium]|nr:FtsQ-type POTRA domain-containing protein [Bryobacteraceae bacterium]